MGCSAAGHRREDATSGRKRSAAFSRPLPLGAGSVGRGVRKDRKASSRPPRLATPDAPPFARDSAGVAAGSGAACVATSGGESERLSANFGASLEGGRRGVESSFDREASISILCSFSFFHACSSPINSPIWRRSASRARAWEAWSCSRASARDSCNRRTVSCASVTPPLPLATAMSGAGGEEGGGVGL